MRYTKLKLGKRQINAFLMENSLMANMSIFVSLYKMKELPHPLTLVKN